MKPSSSSKIIIKTIINFHFLRNQTKPINSFLLLFAFPQKKKKKNLGGSGALELVLDLVAEESEDVSFEGGFAHIEDVTSLKLKQRVFFQSDIENGLLKLMVTNQEGQGSGRRRTSIHRFPQQGSDQVQACHLQLRFLGVPEEQ